jgi:hypothetical protein
MYSVKSQLGVENKKEEGLLRIRFSCWHINNFEGVLWVSYCHMWKSWQTARKISEENSRWIGG